jgi:hypothetical protein
MASIFKRKNANGTPVWQAVVRIDGYPTVCSHWNRKQEAEDWARETETKSNLVSTNLIKAKNSAHSMNFSIIISPTALSNIIDP